MVVHVSVYAPARVTVYAREGCRDAPVAARGGRHCRMSQTPANYGGNERFISPQGEREGSGGTRSRKDDSVTNGRLLCKNSRARFYVDTEK